MLDTRHACCAPIKKLRKIAPGAFPKDLFTKNVPKSRLGCPWARFCKGLGTSNTSRTALGRLLGALGRVLRASWASLGGSWVPPESQMLPKRGSDPILKGSWHVRGRLVRSQGCIFQCLFIHFVIPLCENPVSHAVPLSRQTSSKNPVSLASFVSNRAATPSAYFPAS